MGVLYGIVGVLLAARLDAAAPNGGTFMELEAIAAAVIGGTSLSGASELCRVVFWGLSLCKASRTA